MTVMFRFPNKSPVIFGVGMNGVRSYDLSRFVTGRDNLPEEPPEGGTPNNVLQVTFGDWF